MIVATTVLDLIGRTPLVRVNRLVGSGDAELYAKLEWCNAGGSVKDRMALYLVEHAEAAGGLRKDKTILEATSGNTGIALAMIAAVKGYRLTVVMPDSVSVERRKSITAFGAELILSPGAKGTGGAVELKRRLLQEQPGKYADLDQFRDPANILAHYQTTANEIWEQTQGRIDALVVGIGTAGTGVGCSMRLKALRPGVRVVGVMPKLGVNIQGLRNPAESYPTELFRREWFDEIVEVPAEEIPRTFEVARSAAREEGLFVGMSSGAILGVAIREAKHLGKGVVVAVLPDNGSKYLSTGLYA